METESAVKDRYAAAAQKQEAALCCPVDYDAKYLKAIPTEVIEKDYGCGDPSQWVKPGETVLDLGSGTGKICFIASQVVGETGRVIGIDMTDAMLEVAQRNAPIVAENIGYSNVQFLKGRIQDLALDLNLLDKHLATNPIASTDAWLKSEDQIEKLRQTNPLIVTESIDVVVSNCVLNLVKAELKPQLFRELFRVTKNGGRAVISDIVSNKTIPPHMQADEQLWSGCISGALTQDDFLTAFSDAGFDSVQVAKSESEPWQVVEGIEFHSITIIATKGKNNFGELKDETSSCCSTTNCC